MRTPTLIAIVLGMLLLAAPSKAAPYPDSLHTRLLTEIQDLLYSERYEAADSVANRLILYKPYDPSGYLFKAIGVATRMFDAEDNGNEAQFKSLLGIASALAAGGCDTSRADVAAWMHLYRGHARSWESLYEAHFGSSFAALRAARAGAGEYKKGLVLDSSVYDLYFGLGLYHYWKSAKAGVLRTVGLVADDKDRGLDQLYMAAESSLVSRQAARSALIWIYLDREQYDSSIAICNEMLARYPGGRTFLWPLARAHFESSRYRQAAQTYRLLRERLSGRQGNGYNLIEVDYQLARCYERMEMDSTSRKIAANAVACLDDIPADTAERQRERIAYLRSLSDQPLD